MSYGTNLKDAYVMGTYTGRPSRARNRGAYQTCSPPSSTWLSTPKLARMLGLGGSASLLADEVIE